MANYHRHHLLLTILVFTLIWPIIAQARPKKKKAAPQPAVITNLACFSEGHYTSFVIYLNKIPEYSHGFIPANEDKGLPNRIYIDLSQTDLHATNTGDAALIKGPVQALRFGKQAHHGLRLVLDLSKRQDYKITVFENPTRLTIGLNDLPQIGDENRPQLQYNDTVTDDTPAKPDKGRYLIVLDPGHGGDDTGAVGPTGLQEKNVVLEIALALREELSKNENFDVLLTRNRDTELELKERSNFANHHQADLFISIHSNASTERGVGGFSTYYLNTSSDNFSQRLAAVENSATNEDLAPADLIINDLKMNKTTQSSQKLATSLQNSAMGALASTDFSIRDHGVLTALFYVLLGARMPAALVECNFISNPVEEALLADPAYRKRVVKGIADGIRNYLKAE